MNTATFLGKRSIPVLVIEDNPDHQLLIGYSARERAPKLRPTFTSNVEAALTYLANHCQDAFHPVEFPRLVLLDLFLPHLEQGWHALTQIRTRYPRLPILVLSSLAESALVTKAYDLGAHSYLAKPDDLNDWELLFSHLQDYWLNTVTLTVSC